MRTLVNELQLNIIILCDGGCDIIITGYERHLGTPVEDMMSLCIIHKLEKEGKIKGYITVLGGTVDTFIEMNRSDFLINIKEAKESVKLSLDPSDINHIYVQHYVQIFEQSKPQHSIVNASIVVVLKGFTGPQIPPLLAPIYNKDDFILDEYVTTYYLFECKRVAERNIYLNMICDMDDSDDIDILIMKHHDWIYENVVEYDDKRSYRDNGIGK